MATLTQQSPLFGSLLCEMANPIAHNVNDQSGQGDDGSDDLGRFDPTFGQKNTLYRYGQKMCVINTCAST